MASRGKFPSSDTTSQVTSIIVPDGDPDEAIKKHLLNLKDFSPEELTHFEEVVKRNEDFHRVEEDRIMRLQAEYELITSQEDSLFASPDSCFICTQRFVTLLRPGILCHQCAREACPQHIIKLHQGEFSICTRCQTTNDYVTKTGIWFKEMQLRFSKEEVKDPSVILKLSLSAHREQSRHAEQMESMKKFHSQMDLVEGGRTPSGSRRTIGENNKESSRHSKSSSASLSLKDLLKKRSKPSSREKGAPLSKASSLMTITNVQHESIPEEGELRTRINEQLRLPPGSTQSAPLHKADQYSSVYNIPPDTSGRPASLMLPPRPEMSATKSTVSHRSKGSSKNSSMMRKAASLLSISLHDGDKGSFKSEIDDHSTIVSEVGSLKIQKGRKREDSKATLSTVTSNEGYDPNIIVRGEVSIGLDYDFQRNRFLIYVKECRNLFAIGSDKHNTNPYVKTYLLPDRSKQCKRTTNNKSGTINPVFHEPLVYDVHYPDLQQRSLEVSVWHNQALSHNLFLGETYISLNNWNFDDITPQWYKLNEKKSIPVPLPLLLYRGDIVLSIKLEVGSKNDPLVTSEDTPGTLYVWIKEAKNLLVGGNNRKPDVFLKMYLLPDRSCKKKTSIIKNTINPRWNMMFRYYGISMQTLRESSLEVTVWDRGHFRMYRQLGGIRLNLGRNPNEKMSHIWMDATGHEVMIWERMLNKPNVWIEGVISLRDSTQFMN